MRLPARFFPAIQIEPLIHEALLVPFHVLGKPVGTVWILAQNAERKFDLEDERIVQTLAQFASVGWQLWKAYEAAVDAGRRKDEFMAMLGHEVRNPLGAIIAASEILKTADIQDGRVLTATRVITRQSLQLSRLADDLIDLARIGRGTLELRKELIELQMVLSVAVEATRAQIERLSHTLSVRTPIYPIHIYGDPSRLAQLFTNLLDNASKYTPPGGKIIITADSVNGEALVTVADTGLGIPPDRLNSIFGLFTRLNTKSSSAGGLGIGLALVRTLAELHGGSVDVTSKLGEGSQFLIRLPTQME
jgi:signal transduction histidine kinase